MTAFTADPPGIPDCSACRRHASASRRAVSAQSPRWSETERKISADEKIEVSMRTNWRETASPVIVNRERSGEKPGQVSPVGLVALGRRGPA